MRRHRDWSWHNERLWLQLNPASLMRPQIRADGWEEGYRAYRGWVAFNIADGNCDPFVGVEVHVRGRLAWLVTMLVIGHRKLRGKP